MKFFYVTASFGLSVLPCVTSSPVLEERTACKQDNLLNALVHHVPDSYQFCSSYISVPATSTVTEYTSTCILSSYIEVSTIIHPVNLFNLQPQPYSITATPLVYNSVSPTPIPVPGGAQNYFGPGARRAKRETFTSTISEPIPTPPPSLPQELLRRGTLTVPTYLATTYPASRLSSACSCLSVPAAVTTTVSRGFFSIDFTTTCTSYIPTTVASYPAPCAPSLQANALYPNSHYGYEVVPNFLVPSKMDCCAACFNVFNCAWWKFEFGTTGDGWAPGTCHYAYYTGSVGDFAGEAPAICPNGITQGVLNPVYQIGREANNNDPGYNPGACGNAFNLFESAQDFGYPDGYSEHTCGGWNGQPTANPPGCDG